jgi:putative zinc finger/helix-turn-helix YgiT family protein
MESNMKCPNCKKADAFRRWRGAFELLEGVPVPSTGQECSACGEKLFSSEEVAAQERATADALVERGVRNAPEFKFVRKAAGLKATELAEILGVQPKTIARWESGEVEFPRAVAFALAELYARPRVTKARLEALA